MFKFFFWEKILFSLLKKPLPKKTFRSRFLNVFLNSQFLFSAFILNYKFIFLSSKQIYMNHCIFSCLVVILLLIYEYYFSHFGAKIVKVSDLYGSGFAIAGPEGPIPDDEDGENNSEENSKDKTEPNGFGLNKPKRKKKADRRVGVKKVKVLTSKQLQIFSDIIDLPIDRFIEQANDKILEDISPNQAFSKAEIARYMFAINSNDRENLSSFSAIVRSGNIVFLYYLENKAFPDLASLLDFSRKLLVFENHMLLLLETFKPNCRAYLMQNSSIPLDSATLEKKLQVLLKKIVYDLFVRAAMMGAPGDTRLMWIKSGIISTIGIESVDIKNALGKTFTEEFKLRKLCIILNLFIFHYSLRYGIQGSLYAYLKRNALQFNNLMRKLNYAEKRVNILASLTDFNISNPLIDLDVCEFLQFHRRNLHFGKKKNQKC